jgi:hypothetical protein
MQVIKPPTFPKEFLFGKCAKSLFLAGSIEMGEAENWQEYVQSFLADTDFTIFNPRRDDWDSSWVQSKDNPQFVAQVSWELTALERVDYILMYFDPGTKSPISLLELGLFRSHNLIVVCPERFWRKGNVDIVCQRYGITQYDTLDEAILALKGL